MNLSKLTYICMYYIHVCIYSHYSLYFNFIRCHVKQHNPYSSHSVNYLEGYFSSIQLMSGIKNEQ